MLQNLDLGELGLEDEEAKRAKRDLLIRNTSATGKTAQTPHAFIKAMNTHAMAGVPNVRVDEPRPNLFPLTRDSSMDSVTAPGLVTNTERGTSEQTVAKIPDQLMRPLPPSQKTQGKMQEIYDKDYSQGLYLDDETDKPTRKRGRGGEQFDPIQAPGKDRDKEWSLGEKIGSFVKGAASGGALGGITAAMDRNYSEKEADQNQLMRLNAQQQQQMKAEDFQGDQLFRQAQTANIYADNENQKNNAEVRKQIAERNSVLRQLGLMKRYKRGNNPDFDTKLESLGIEQPDFEPGKKIKPRFWDNRTGKLMTFDDNNATVPVITPDGKEVINDSRKEVESGGYTVMPSVARAADAQVESSQVTAGNKTRENEREYKIATAKLNSKIASSNTRISDIKNSLSALENLTGIEKLRSVDQKIQLQKELREETAELAGYEEEKRLTPAPAEVEGRTGLNVGNYSEQQFRQIFKDKTPQQLETLIKNAKAQGIIK